MKLTITQEDIDNGEVGDPCWCPIANAIARACNIEDKARRDCIEVNSDGIWINGTTIYSSRILYPHKVPMPRQLKDFINNFDNEEEVEPFEIEIPYENN